MDEIQIASSAALTIGAIIVGWCALRCQTLADRIATQGERIAKLEAVKPCACGGEDGQ